MNTNFAKLGTIFIWCKAKPNQQYLCKFNNKETCPYEALTPEGTLCLSNDAKIEKLSELVKELKERIK